jgi:hypothetical protein
MEVPQKYDKLIQGQKEQKIKIEEIFETVLNMSGISEKIKIELEFKGGGDLVVAKIKEKSSVKFLVMQNKEKIIEKFNKSYPKKLLRLI